MEERNFLRPAISLAMLIAGIVMSAFDVELFAVSYVKLAWYAIAFLLVGIDVIKEAIECAVKEHEVFSEFMLMTIASIGAFIIGEYPEGVAVMLFYCIGETLQDMAVDKAKDNIKSLIAFRPDHAMVLIDGILTEKKPEDVCVNDVIEVKPGERVPLDGEVISADSTFNTAALTGESAPRLIEKGKEALAGMIAVDSVVRLRVTRPSGESAVSRILNMVEEASARKAPAELFIRKFARIYTPTVIGLALLTVVLPFLWSLASPSFSYIFSDWFYRALIFLVISCPCALVISIPLGYFGGIGAASTKGILFKGGNYLDAITHIDTVVFDKTGTLTTGEFSVVKVDEMGENEFLKVVSSIERNSNHPIAKAIVKYAGDEIADVSDVKDMPGYGLSAMSGNDKWLAGTLRLLQRENVSYPKELENLPETIVACAKNGEYIGYILLADTLKEDSVNAIGLLKDNGISNVEIMSGDKQALVDKVAKALNVDKGYGDLFPEGKVRHIEELKKQGRNVAFIGDGINDAPVLALSNVGIAMGALGSDMAIETADIVIQTDQPSKVAAAIKIGKRTKAIVKQNIFFAIGVKVLVMLLGVLGFANLWAAVFADVGVALLAVLNATRIFLYKD